MKIHLEHLGAEPLNWQEDVNVSCAELDRPELVGLSLIKAQGTIGSVFAGYLLSASLSYAQTVTCNRCLRKMSLQVQAEFSLLMMVEGQKELDDVELQLTADDLNAVQLASPELDTRPWLVEQVQLNVPMKPVCSEGCKGLCGSCGSDLNSGPCDCLEQVDPRWAALRGLQKSFEK
jgi:uncharacterized protein